MKKALSLLLAVLLAVCVLAACGGETEQAPKETTSVSAYKSEGEYTAIADHLSWEGINAFPIKTSDMSIEDARELCISFFRYCKTATWIPDDNWDFTHHDNGDGPDTLNAGVVYGGLPYVGLASSAIYRVLDYMDPETGVVNIQSAGQFQKQFGNQCANGAYQGWSRVINSAKYSGTPKMTKVNGFIPVGDYTYDNIDVLPGWSDGYGTDEVCQQNGAEVLYESYAKMIRGDGFVNYTTAGHVVMLASDPVVVRGEDGKIDPAQSYVTVLDQTPQWGTGTTEDGVTYSYQNNVDTKWTFNKLFLGNYLPFTYGEWLGTDPIEETEYTFTHEGETATLKDLTKAKLTCNYHIYDLYLEVCDKWGSQVLKIAARNDSASEYTMQLSTLESATNVIWGNVNGLTAGGEYTAKVYAQLGTGERLTLWEGKLTVE